MLAELLLVFAITGAQPATAEHAADMLEGAARDSRPEPPATPDPPPSEPVAKPDVPEPWRSLAQCESGDWIDGGTSFVDGSARWDWAKPGTDVPPWGTRIHHGGLQFHPDTWAWVAPDVLEDPPTYAYDATPGQQVAVAVEVQIRQGWAAWPVCSRLVGLR